jgi:hypothetical protein
MTTAVSPTQILNDARRIEWGTWVMNQHLQRWAEQARSEWVGHELKEIRK